MKQPLLKKAGILFSFCFSLLTGLKAQNPGLIISEILSNPAGTDSPFEYVEFRASKFIDFSITPYSVVVCNNGTATSGGWVSGGALSYGFSINTGTVNTGDVVYVGGSSMAPLGTKLRIINTGTTAGDAFGTANSAGVFGNGGSNADGVAVFAADISTLTNSTVPVDALFYGSAIGSATVSGGTAGYQLPINDRYNGGKLQGTSFTAPDPASGDIIKATGTFNLTSNTWSTIRAFSTTTTMTDGTSSISLVTGDVIPPTVSSAVLNGNTLVKVKFSEVVTVASATTISNYTFTPAVVINTITLNASGDTAAISLSSPLPVGVTHTLSITGITDLAANTMTITQNFTLLNTGITVKHYTWNHPQTIGTYQGLAIPNGGFSGLNYIKGTSNEFYVITDRGPNLDANNNHYAIDMGGSNNTAKLFALPAFNPNVMRFKAQGDSLVYLSSFAFKRPDNSSTTGLINPTQTGGTGEIALLDTAGTLGMPDVWGIDSEGITDGNDNDFWVSEEYGVSIWHTTNDGKVINRYAPFGGLPGAQAEDMAIDTIFKYRNPNKGFEGVAFTPNKKVYGFIQNTILFPASDANLKKNTRLHRFVEINAQNNTTRMLGYQHDAVPASGALSSIKNDKRYIGDAVAVNDHEVLILEHGKSSTESYGKVYLVDVSTATAINPVNHLVYAGGTKSFEQLLDSTTAAANGVTVAKKTLLIDLVANGYDPAIEKKEGLTIINDTCIAIANDNDFGIISNNSDGVASLTNVKSYIYVFSFPRSRKLNLCDNVTITASALSICSSDSVLLNTPVKSGINYQWKNNTNSIANATTASFYAKANGTYELYATNANGCTAISNAKVITVLPTPTVVATTNLATICEGQTVTLNAGGATSYTWTGGTNNASYTVTPSTSTVYSVTGTSTNGCTHSSTIAITVNTNPTVTINSGQLVICPNSLTTLTVSGASTYTWTDNSTNAIYTVSPTTDMTYSVTGTDSNGCIGSSAITVSVNPTPSISISASNTVVCSGNGLSLTANGASTYSWTNGPSASTYSVTPSISTTYTVEGTDGNLCSNTAMITITVNVTPTVSASSSSYTICAGQTATLTGSGASSYSWMPSGSASATEIVSPVSNATYSLTGYDNGCEATTTVAVAVNQLPSISASTSNSLICTGENAVLTAISSASTYSWSNGATTMSTTISPSITTIYSVTVTDGLCSSTASITQSVSLCTGVNTIDSDNASIAIYPNPFHHSFEVKWNNHFSNDKETLLMIYNTLGEMVLMKKTSEQSITIDTRDWRCGAYFIKVNNKVYKIIKTEN
ncbi:MAG: esterase-like activity of phytase family protein [Bacteroidetes bacterium]|nr:esterase-like activity of phytase family protein [Bacteroidota bacterium]